jgi:hypothetical protein
VYRAVAFLASIDSGFEQLKNVHVMFLAIQIAKGFKLLKNVHRDQLIRSARKGNGDMY